MNKKRLSILKKQNRLKQILPDLFNRLKEVEPKLEGAIILNVEEVEELHFKSNRNNQETVLIQKTTISEPSLIYNVLNKLANKLNQKNYFSIGKLSQLWYAEINSKFVVTNFEKIIQIDSNFFIIHDKALNNGLWIDMSKENWYKDGEANLIYVYELKVWGQDWTSQLVNDL